MTLASPFTTAAQDLPANQIIRGDCNAVLKDLPAASVDFILTDPPYGVRYRDRTGRTVNNDDDLTPVLSAFPDLHRVLKPNSFCVSFYGWNRIGEFFPAWTGAGFRPVGHIVFEKDYASKTGMMNHRHEQAYLLAKGHPRPPPHPIDDVLPWDYSGNRAHPTEKSVRTLKPLIECFCPAGGMVLDPFSGSGSTSVAAALTGRRYLGIELEDGYCAHARRRLAGVARLFAPATN